MLPNYEEKITEISQRSTKQEMLRRMQLVALVHISAHGKKENW